MESTVIDSKKYVLISVKEYNRLIDIDNKKKEKYRKTQDENKRINLLKKNVLSPEEVMFLLENVS